MMGLKKSDLLFQKDDLVDASRPKSVIFLYKLKLVDASSPELVIFLYKLKLESQQRCLESWMTKNRTGFSLELDDI